MFHETNSDCIPCHTADQRSEQKKITTKFWQHNNRVPLLQSMRASKTQHQHHVTPAVWHEMQHRPGRQKEPADTPPTILEIESRTDASWNHNAPLAATPFSEKRGMQKQNVPDWPKKQTTQTGQRGKTVVDLGNNLVVHGLEFLPFMGIHHRG